jgi:hypothetical protein
MNTPPRKRLCPLPLILGLTGLLVIVVVGTLVLRSLLTEKVIARAALPGLILKASEVPTDLFDASPQIPAATNDTYAASFGGLQTSPADVLKQLNDLGRIFDAGFSYEPDTEDLCQYETGPHAVFGKIDLFKSVNGARKGFEWGKTFEGFYWTGLAGYEKVPEVGEQSWYAYNKGTQPISLTCSSHQDFYRLFFQRANTNVWLQVFVLDTTLTDDAVKKLIISYGKIIDQRIITTAK